MFHAPNARLCGTPRMMSDLFDFTNLQLLLSNCSAQAQLSSNSLRSHSSSSTHADPDLSSISKYFKRLVDTGRSRGIDR